eukprot:351783-Chlamydomonas_euryale.AAC.3
MSEAGCAVLMPEMDAFKYMFQLTSVEALATSSRGTMLIAAGDVMLNSLETTCQAQTQARHLLSGGETSIDASVTLPPGTTNEQDAAVREAFAKEATSAYSSGTYASVLGVTSAQVTSDVMTMTYPAGETEASDAALPLALGLGLGIGVPVIALVVAAAVLFTRKQRQKVLPQPSFTNVTELVDGGSPFNAQDVPVLPVEGLPEDKRLGDNVRSEPSLEMRAQAK